MFYLSEYLENNREEYYLRLRAISQQGDWNRWLAFFLRAIIEQGKQNSARVSAILSFPKLINIAEGKKIV